MLDRPSAPLLEFERGPEVAVGQLVLGKPVTEAAQIVPRLFNLCRGAQTLAIRRAFGLETGPTVHENMRSEIRRDHVMKLALTWPGHFGLPACTLPSDWRENDRALAEVVFGPQAAPPGSYADLTGWLDSDAGFAPLFRQIRALFDRRLGDPGVLPATDATRLCTTSAQENSVAGRQADRPVMRAVAARDGHGPLWRALARIYDLSDLLTGRFATEIHVRPGLAIVPATRGAYTVIGSAIDGRVTQFRRITPTDHLTAPNGILERTLAALPADRAELAPALMDILDPCHPVTLRRVQHA